MSVKLFTDYTEASSAAGSDYLLIHDGSGVKKIQKSNLLAEEAIALALADRDYEGVDLTDKFADEIANFSDEWAWIQDRLDNGNIADLHTGDFIPFTCMGESHEAQIAGKKTYTGTGDTEIGDMIDFISRDCLSTTVQFNTSNTNNGSSTNANPFLASNLKTWLDGTVYPTLDSSLKSVIKTKRILAPSRYTSGSTLTDDISWAWADFDKLWVPLENEIFDQAVWCTKGYGNGQAVQYPIFANSYKARMKGAGPGGSRCNWWAASARSGYSTAVVSVLNNGHSHNGNASDAYRVPVCFRLIAE